MRGKIEVLTVEHVQSLRAIRARGETGQCMMVLMRGPGGEFEIPFDEAIFGGPARCESRNYWITREGAEPVIVPDVERFGEKDQTTSQQNWEEVPAGTALEGPLISHATRQSLWAAEGGHTTRNRGSARPAGKRSRTGAERGHPPPTSRDTPLCRRGWDSWRSVNGEQEASIEVLKTN
jgi:hypothetical protein